MHANETAQYNRLEKTLMLGLKKKDLFYFNPNSYYYSLEKFIEKMVKIFMINKIYYYCHIDLNRFAIRYW